MAVLLKVLVLTSLGTPKGTGPGETGEHVQRVGNKMSEFGWGWGARGGGVLQL